MVKQYFYQIQKNTFQNWKRCTGIAKIYFNQDEIYIKLYPYKSLTANMGIVINAQISLTIQLTSTWELKEG